MYLYGSIRTYLEAASSAQPTPGGGSVAALAGALGMSMACMAANFTTGKKKFESVEAEVQEHLAACLRARDELLRLMDEDTLAYATVSAAYAMPKETPEQKAARSEAIQKALVVAMGAPLTALRACRDVMPAIARLAQIANPNLISDVGVAALLCEAALRAAKLNVEINLSGLDDKGFAEATRREINAASQQTAELARTTLAAVTKAIGGTM